MLYAIVLLWMAIKLDAPLWIYIIVCFLIVGQTISTIGQLLEEIDKRKWRRKFDRQIDEIRSINKERVAEWLNEEQNDD